jgi:hypothetical protein
MGRKLALPAAPSRRASLASARCRFAARARHLCAMDARYLCSCCGRRAILLGARYFLSNRNAGGRLPGGSRTSSPSLHAKPRREFGRDSRVYGAGILLFTALGLDSAGLCRATVFFFPAYTGRSDSRWSTACGRCNRDQQPRSVVALLSHYVCSDAGAKLPFGRRSRLLPGFAQPWTVGQSRGCSITSTLLRFPLCHSPAVRTSLDHWSRDWQ